MSFNFDIYPSSPIEQYFSRYMSKLKLIFLELHDCVAEKVRNFYSL